MNPKVSIFALENFPEIKKGDDLSNIIINCISESKINLNDGDVICIAQKVISKAEGCIYNLDDMQPLSVSAWVKRIGLGYVLSKRTESTGYWRLGLDANNFGWFRDLRHLVMTFPYPHPRRQSRCCALTLLLRKYTLLLVYSRDLEKERKKRCR